MVTGITIPNPIIHLLEKAVLTILHFTTDAKKGFLIIIIIIILYNNNNINNNNNNNNNNKLLFIQANLSVETVLHS